MSYSSSKTATLPSNFFSGKEVLKIFSLYILLQLLFSVAISFLFLTGNLNINNKGFGLIQITAISFFSFGVLFYLFKKDRLFKELLFHSTNPSKAFSLEGITYLKYGLMALIVAIPLTFLTKYLVMTLGGFEETKQTLVKQFELLKNQPFLFFTLGTLIALLPPLIEEILFRGFLQSYLKAKWGSKLAIILTAIIFTLFHFEIGLGIGNVEILTSLFVMALFLSFIKEKFQSLWAPIGMHMGFNAFSVLMVWFSLNI
jgi:membrane protease YdiL (CAAX protease family)